MTVADLTLAYLAYNCHLSGTSLVPTSGPGTTIAFILADPILVAGGTVTFHVSGTFNTSTSIDFSSALSSDSAGYTGSFQYELAHPFTDPVLTTQTLTATAGTGVWQYDAAVTAGEVFVLISVARCTVVTAVTYDVTGAAAPILSASRRRRPSPLRRYPRDDGLAGQPRRMYPPPTSTQASNRRAGGYL